MRYGPEAGNINGRRLLSGSFERARVCQEWDSDPLDMVHRAFGIDAGLDRILLLWFIDKEGLDEAVC